MSIGSRIKHAREMRGLSQTQLGILCGWDEGSARARISNYERSARDIKISDIIKIASILKIDHAWIAFGNGPFPDNSDIETTNYSLQQQIPIIPWSALSEWTMDDFMDKEKQKSYQLIDNFKNIKDGFAVVVTNDAMMAEKGKTFIEGEILFIDPHQKPEHNDFVIALINGEEPTFRQYVKDSGKSYLKPLNKSYETFIVDEKTIILGVVKSKISDV